MKTAAHLHRVLTNNPEIEKLTRDMLATEQDLLMKKIAVVKAYQHNVKSDAVVTNELETLKRLLQSNLQKQGNGAEHISTVLGRL